MNQHRQAVLVNDKLAALLNMPAVELLGLRPGEMLDCVRWRLEPWGCGTTTFCRACGAVRAILNSQHCDAPDVQECHMLCDANGGVAALDLRVWATPITIAGERLTVFAIQDITDENRRAVLERLFFHDILNTADGLRAIIETWPDLNGSEARRPARWLQLGRRTLGGDPVGQRSGSGRKGGATSHVPAGRCRWFAVRPLRLLPASLGRRGQNHCAGSSFRPGSLSNPARCCFAV